jgi:hypothetical protein
MMTGLVKGFPVIEFMIGQDQALKDAMKDTVVDVDIVGYGETKEL